MRTLRCEGRVTVMMVVIALKEEVVRIMCMVHKVAEWVQRKGVSMTI